MAPISHFIRIYETFVNSLGDILVIFIHEYNNFLNLLNEQENSDYLIRCWAKIIENELEDNISKIIDDYDKSNLGFKEWIRKNLSCIWKCHQRITYEELCLFKETPRFSRANEVL